MNRFDRIDTSLMTPVVRKLLGKDDARIVDWECEKVKGDGDTSTRLVCRIFGKAASEGEELPWSLFLKVPNPTSEAYQEWNREPFQREVLLFRSGILVDLPGGILAPRCIDVMELDGDEPWMWLEHIEGKPSLQWPLERFGLTGRQFGRMQGAFMAGTPLPDLPWLDNSRVLRLRLEAGVQRAAPALRDLHGHPFTKDLFVEETGRSLLSLWDQRETFFDAMERLPKSLCHGDFCYGNLFDCPQKNGEPMTGVIDWQYAGRRPIGSDVAGLIADSSILPARRKAAEPEDFTHLLLDAYLEGLKESGWEGDLRLPRFSVLAFLSLPWTFNLLGSVRARVVDNDSPREDREEREQKARDYLGTLAFLMELGNEARDLLNRIEF